MRLYSEAFEDQGILPEKYTCRGEGITPPLTLEEVPQETHTMAIIAESTDGETSRCHWLIYEIPYSVIGLPEGVPGAASVSGMLQGFNDFDTIGYKAPCTDEKPLTIRFTLYALSSSAQEAGAGLNKRQFLERFEKDILESVTLEAKVEAGA